MRISKKMQFLLAIHLGKWFIQGIETRIPGSEALIKGRAYAAPWKKLSLPWINGYKQNSQEEHNSIRSKVIAPLLSL